MFAAVLASDELLAEVERRAERVRAFYALAPVAICRVEPRMAAGVLGVAMDADAAAGARGLLVWGEPLPDRLALPDALIDATDEDLRSIAGVTVAIAWGDGRWRIANNSAGPATLYVAKGDGVTAYATHAVAAALIAGIEPRVDATAVPEFVALDFVGGERTLVEGVRVVPPASAVGVDGARSYWPAAERWASVPDADAHTESALLRTLGERAGEAPVGLALTAGLDSTVGAAALAELGVSPLAFTWGSAGWPDARGAAATAARLGFKHEVLGVRALADEDCLSALDRDARWTDGMTALSAAERHWPEACETLAVGMGGETGRAFYFDAWSALLVPDPSPEELARRLGARGRLRGASDEAQAAVERNVRAWVDEALELGVRGWTALDVLYTEQRVRRWGRSQIPPLGQNLVLLFTPAEVARGLASLPVRERIRDGFHRRFLAARGLPVDQPDVPDPGRLELALRRLRARTRRPPAATAPDDPVDRLVAHVWSERPTTRDWLCEDALQDPLITGTLGAAWATATAAGFAEGRARTAERAARAAGVVAFSRALNGSPATTE
jgi:Asparagine synthase